MLNEIKKLQGINHNEFDSIIQNLIFSAKEDLKAVGIVKQKVVEEDALIKTALITYVISFLDVPNSEMYKSSYAMQKDVLRHLSEYIEE